MTDYDPQGRVTRVHSVDFKLEDGGPVRLFTWTNMGTLVVKQEGDHLVGRNPEPGGIWAEFYPESDSEFSTKAGGGFVAGKFGIPFIRGAHGALNHALELLRGRASRLTPRKSP